MQSARIVLHIEREMTLHIAYCNGFGLPKEEIELEEESQGVKLCAPNYESLLTFVQHVLHIQGTY